MLKTLLFISIFLINFSATANNSPPIQLANIYRSDIDVTKYLVSEKLDGLRAYWDGKNLISKEGNLYFPPEWFIENFPKEHLEGELWISRGKFELVSGTVRKEIPTNDWQQIHFMLFDLPQSLDPFEKRFEILKNLVEKSHSKYLKVIDQSKIIDKKSLMKRLAEVVKNNGEGLMLHRADSLYKATRNDDLLKLKTYEDAEAQVIEIVPGHGKYQGMMGAILVENEEGIKFKIGTGFSDDERTSPPKIGSIITYKFFGKTKNNKPRFASFVRVREDYVMKSK